MSDALFYSNFFYAAPMKTVSGAGALIKLCLSKIEREAFRGAGIPVRVERLGNDREEARYIAKCIRFFHDEEGMPFSGNAVLYRTNAQARAEVKGVLAYLRLTVNPDDDEASRTGKSLLATAEETLSIPGFFRPSAEKAVGAFVRQVWLDRFRPRGGTQAFLRVRYEGKGPPRSHVLPGALEIR